jgi:hypothetical protein
MKIRIYLTSVEQKKTADQGVVGCSLGKGLTRY